MSRPFDPFPKPIATKPPLKRPTARERLRRVRAQMHNVALVLVGIAIAFATLLAYNLLTASSQITPKDVKQIVAEAMASATPPPPAAVGAFEIIAPSVVDIQTLVLTTDGKTEGGRGTGVVLDEAGDILTALHVVDNAIDLEVVFADGTRSAATIVSKDADNDIAVVRASSPPAQLIPATLGNPGALRVGDEAIVVGDPFRLRHTLTSGSVSGLEREFHPPNGKTMKGMIQFDAAVNPGNSGGPLLNSAGEVVGIVTGLLNPTEQNVFIGIGFAVPINVAAQAAGSPPY